MPEARWMHRKAEEADSSAIGDDDSACFPPAAVGPSLPPAAVGQARRRLDPADPGRTSGPTHLVGARVAEDVEAEVAVAGGDVLLTALLEDLHTPEVVAALVDEVAHF